MDRYTREQWQVFWSFIGICAVVAAVLWALFIGFAPRAFGATAVTVSWDASAEPDVIGYRIRWRVDGQTTYTVLDVGDVTTVRLASLPDNVKLWFSGQAYDSFAQDSPWSAPEVYSPAIPKTMGNLKVIRVEMLK